MEVVEIERELWRIARLRDKALVLEAQVVFVQGLIRNYIRNNADPWMVKEVLRGCYASLGSIKIQRDVAEQRVRTCVERSARNRATRR